MMRLLLTAAACIAFTAMNVCSAPIQLDTLKVGSRTYTNVTVSGANLTDMYFTHDAGMANVKLKYLSKDLQKRLNYDPRAAAEAEKQAELENALFQTMVSSNSLAKAQARTREEPDFKSAPSIFGDPVSETSLIGKRVPVLEDEQLSPTLSHAKGKYVILAFQTAASEACRQAMPALVALQKRFPDRLLLLRVGLNAGGSGEDSTEWGADVPVVTDEKLSLASAIGISSVPSVALISPEGILIYQGHPAAIDEAKLRRVFAQE